MSFKQKSLFGFVKKFTSKHTITVNSSLISNALDDKDTAKNGGLNKLIAHFSRNHKQKEERRMYTVAGSTCTNDYEEKNKESILAEFQTCTLKTEVVNGSFNDIFKEIERNMLKSAQLDSEVESKNLVYNDILFDYIKSNKNIEGEVSNKISVVMQARIKMSKLKSNLVTNLVLICQKENKRQRLMKLKEKLLGIKDFMEKCKVDNDEWDTEKINELVAESLRQDYQRLKCTEYFGNKKSGS